jgi:hypothetical protein
MNYEYNVESATNSKCTRTQLENRLHILRKLI